MDIHGNMLVMGNITNYGIPSRQKLDDIPSSSGMVTHFYQDLYIYIYPLCSDTHCGMTAKHHMLTMASHQTKRIQSPKNRDFTGVSVG